jgi:PAS domain S-box-containing protein
VNNKQLQVVVVANNASDTEAMVRAFASEPDTTVQTAGTLREYKLLLTAPASKQPNLLIMDLELPDGSAREIVSTPLEEAPFPVLILVDGGREHGVLEALQAGAIDYVVKSPWELAHMPHKAHRILREWHLLQEGMRAKTIIAQLATGWQQTLDAIPYPVFLRDGDGVVTQCNQATLDFFAKSKAEIIGVHCWEFVHQTGTPICNCPLPAMLRSRQREIMILPLTDRIFQVTVDPLINSDGAVIGAVHSLEDITERQRTEETLRAQEAELGAIYENAPFVMMLVDSKHRIRKVNRQAVSLAGSSAAEMIGHRRGEAMGCIHAFEHPDGCGFGPHCKGCAIRRTIVDTIESGHSHYQVEVFIAMADRETTLPFLLSTSRIILRGESMALVSFVNIGQLKQAEEALRLTNERMATVLDSLNALIYVADMSTYELLFVNKYGREVWGEIEGRVCWQTLQSGQDGPCPFCTNGRLLKEDGTPAGVYVWEFQNTVNGHWYDCRDQAIRWSDGRLVRIEIATDITARKLAEEQLRHSQKMDTIGTLAGGIAHDFNNILTPILGFAHLAHDDLPPESQTAKDIQQVIHAGERAKELVKQILTFSRQRAEECQPVQASLLVKEALKLLRSSIPATIAIRASIQADGLTIMIDPTKLHQVVMNLCTNAYQAMKAGGGTMSVALEPIVFAAGALFGHDEVEGEYLRLTVQDTGCGMDQATMERIFEPYFTTKDHEDGTGLGLSVVHGIVHNANGRIAVQSTLGQGSVFQVIWPIVRKESTVQGQGAVVISLPRGNEHILLVDDEPTVLSTHERELRSLGYQVTSRDCPLAALEVFQRSPELFSLVITDYAMPKMDGLALAHKLLAISPGVKIVLVTGFSELLTKESMAGTGIQKLLLKPVQRKELALTIRSVLGEKVDFGQ